MKFKIVINEVWQAEHLVEADSAEEAEELADLTDNFLVESHMIANGGFRSITNLLTNEESE